MSTTGSFSLLSILLALLRCSLKGILCRTHILKEGEKLSELRVITTHIMGVVEGTTKWYCGYCYEEFAVLKDLRNHTNNSHQGKKYRCDICMDFSSKKFDTIAGKQYLGRKVCCSILMQLIFCVFKHLGVACLLNKTFIFCDHSFQGHKIKLHNTATETFEMIQCQMCNFKTYRQSNLDYHIMTHHSEEYTKSTCGVCGKRFPSAFNAQLHVEQVHMKIKR